MHFCTADILIGGDERNVCARTEFNPVSWPEVEILQVIHGEDSVRNVRPFASVAQSPRAERDRLAGIYGDEPLARRWGGFNAPANMEAPKINNATDTVWYNPVTFRTEKITADGRSKGYVIPDYIPPSRTRMLGIPDDDSDIVGDAEFLKNPGAVIAARQRQREAEGDRYVEEDDEPVYPPEGIAEAAAADQEKVAREARAAARRGK